MKHVSLVFRQKTRPKKASFLYFGQTALKNRQKTSNFAVRKTAFWTLDELFVLWIIYLQLYGIFSVKLWIRGKWLVSIYGIARRICTCIGAILFETTNNFDGRPSIFRQTAHIVGIWKRLLKNYLFYSILCLFLWCIIIPSKINRKGDKYVLHR